MYIYFFWGGEGKCDELLVLYWGPHFFMHFFLLWLLRDQVVNVEHLYHRPPPLYLWFCYSGQMSRTVAIKYPWLTSVTIRDFSHTVRDFEPYIRDWSLAYSYIYVVRAYALRSAIKDLSKLFSNKIWDTKQRRNRNTDKANDGGRRMVHCLTILLNG